MISVIIPLHESENEHPALLKNLARYNFEIIESREDTRAKSLNTGAEKATSENLWFLHADSRIDVRSVTHLLSSIENKPQALHYFDLQFHGGPFLMLLNSLGANLRSRIFGLPFGDQGLCLRKDLYDKTGGYPEDVNYGEDHCFIWRARKIGVKTTPIGAPLSTSARKYTDNGWFKTTLQHQYLWIKQAFSEWLRPHSPAS